MEYQGAGRSAAFHAIAEKVCRNTRLVLEEAETKGILPRKAAVDLAVQRLKKSMSYRRFAEAYQIHRGIVYRFQEYLLQIKW
jgi:glutamate dehydrogenase (NAD(P)+)